MSRKKSREEEPSDVPFYPPLSSKRRRRRRRPMAAAAETAASGPEYDAGGEGEEGMLVGGGRSTASALVLVNGLPSDCTVLELKSRLEMYGPISRTRIDDDEGVGYVTYRSPDSARAAISAAMDPVFGITVGSRRVHVCQFSDPVPQWRMGVGVSAPSKLLRPELPLRKHGRGNKKLSEGTTSSNQSGPELPFKGREIVAYDDLL